MEPSNLDLKRPIKRPVDYNNYLNRFEEVYTSHKASTSEESKPSIVKSNLRIRQVPKIRAQRVKKSSKTISSNTRGSDNDVITKQQIFKQNNNDIIDNFFDHDTENSNSRSISSNSTYNHQEEKQLVDLDFLKKFTGMSEKKLVTSSKIELKTDISKDPSPLQTVGFMLPNLLYLKLSMSLIPSLSRLGSSFSHIRVLWLSQCELKDLEGLYNFSSLQELYCSFNYISELPMVEMQNSLNKLKVLDLEGNTIYTKNALEGLKYLPNLEELTLRDNPLEDDFTDLLQILVPRLKLLDDLHPKIAAKQIIKKRKKRAKKGNRAKYVRQDLQSGASTFLKKLDSSFLRGFVNENNLEVDSLIQSLIEQGESRNDLDEEEMLMNNCRQSSIANEIGVDLDKEINGDLSLDQQKVYGNTAKMIKERRKEYFTTKGENGLTKSTDLSNLMEKFGIKETRFNNRKNLKKIREEEEDDILDIELEQLKNRKKDLSPQQSSKFVTDKPLKGERKIRSRKTASRTRIRRVGKNRKGSNFLIKKK